MRGVELRLDAGDVAVAAGPSGSGKTTLILAVSGALSNLLGGRVDGGVRLSGVDPLSPEGFKEVPRVLGVVLQDPDKQIAMPTPLDEVAFTLENLGYPSGEAEERALEALERFGLAGKVLDPVEALSGGEKRRLTLAAASVVEPSVVMMDEPTASLDPWSVGDVRSYVRESSRRGSSVLIVEHKLRYFLDVAGEVIVFSEGSLRARMSAERAARLSDELEAMGVDAGEPRLEEPRGACLEEVARAEDLVVGRGGRPLIRADSLRLCRGEVVAIVGPNGSGKTTLLKTLAGGLKPLSGELRVAGRAFYVPQTPDYTFLYPTVAEDLEDASRRGGGDPWRLLKRPEWLERVSGLHGSRLSLGQRRYTSIAIALSYSPSALLLDEPSAGLDLRLYSTLEQALRSASRAAAVVVATHDVRLVAGVADRVYVVRGGRLYEVDKGEAVEVMESAWRV